jgi:hypothetical protein
MVFLIWLDEVDKFHPPHIQATIKGAGADKKPVGEDMWADLIFGTKKPRKSAVF